MINHVTANFATQKQVFGTNQYKNKTMNSMYLRCYNDTLNNKAQKVSFHGVNSGDILRGIYSKLNLSVSKISVFEEEVKQRVAIPSSSKKGMNQIVGLEKLKQGMYDDVLTPLLLFAEHIQISKPNGICLFGPIGTGKTYFAEQMGEHFAFKGGTFDKLRFSGDSGSDIQYLNAKFNEAKKAFIESGKKKYRVFFIDEIEKKFDKNNAEQMKVFNKLMTLSQNCNDNGVVLVSTINYLDKIDPEFFRKGRTDMLIPMDYVNNNDLTSLISHYIEKNHLPVDENTNIDKVSDEINKKGYKYKPKDIEKILIDEARYLVDYGGELNNKSLKNIFIDNHPEFGDQEYEQFCKDKEYAKSLGIFYNYEENIRGSEDYKYALLKIKRKLLGLEKEEQKFQEQAINLKSELLQLATIAKSIELG